MAAASGPGSGLEGGGGADGREAVAAALSGLGPEKPTNVRLENSAGK